MAPSFLLCNGAPYDPYRLDRQKKSSLDIVRLMEMAIQAAREIIIALGHTVQKVFISTSLDFQ